MKSAVPWSVKGVEHETREAAKAAGAQPITFPADERVKWAKEVGVFTEKLTGLTDKARELKTILESGAPIKATPASLKTLKVQLFTINDALEQSMAIAERLETEIVPR